MTKAQIEAESYALGNQNVCESELANILNCKPDEVAEMMENIGYKKCPCCCAYEDMYGGGEKEGFDWVCDDCADQEDGW